MQIAIASLSRAILDCLAMPGPLGVIHSVFDRAVNIKLADSQRIIAITFSQAGGLPYAMMLADGQLDSFIKARIKPGQKVNLSDDRCLTIEGTKLFFNYHEASLWSPSMGHLSNPANIGSFLELLAWSSEYIFNQANHAGLVPLLENHRLLFDGNISINDEPDLRVAQLAAPVIAGFLAAIKTGNKKVLASSTVKLLGYGIGGTPSGDDLLVGILAALQRSRDPRAKPYSSLLKSALKYQLTDKITSFLSLTVLKHALLGEFSEKIHEVTRQLMHPDDQGSLKASLDLLLLHGATSGSEMFLGICLGFEMIYAC